VRFLRSVFCALLTSLVREHPVPSIRGDLLIFLPRKSPNKEGKWRAHLTQKGAAVQFPAAPRRLSQQRHNKVARSRMNLIGLSIKANKSGRIFRLGEMSKQMPWRPIGKMDEEKLGGVCEHLTHLPGS
jgi:hypothetical protein